MFLNTWKARLCGLALCLVCGAYANASSLTIQFTGLDLVYDGTNLFDAKYANTTRGSNPAQADALTTVTFYVDDVNVGSVLTSNIFADVYLKGITGIPAAGGSVTSSGNGGAFGVDLLTNGDSGAGVALQIDKVQFSYMKEDFNGHSKFSLAASGVATDLFWQSLPFTLAFDKTQPVSFILSSTSVSNITTQGGIVTGFRAAGTGQIDGATAVPLPSAAWAGLGLLGALGVNRVRKARNA